jgi:hypothetical protein
VRHRRNSRAFLDDRIDMANGHRDLSLARALRETAQRLRDGARYEWGHVGRCNCGHLVQTLTELDDARILRSFRHDLTEWSELAQDYCSITGHEVDDLFRALFARGLTLDDVRHLEYLSDPAVLRRLPEDRRRDLRRNVRADVIAYMEAFAELIEERVQRTTTALVGVGVGA